MSFTTSDNNYILFSAINMNQDNRKERKVQTSQQYAMTPNTQTHPQYSIPITNQFQTLPSEDFPPLTYA